MFEVKTLHLGTSTYPLPEKHRHAVKEEARATSWEYLQKARCLDQDKCGNDSSVELTSSMLDELLLGSSAAGES